MKSKKEGEMRKQEIILAARGLFVKRGYDQTSVDEVLKIVGIAKGTFYYYFESKEELLDAIIIDIVDEGVIRAENILKDKSIPLLPRIMMAIMAQAEKFEGSDRIRVRIHNADNTRLERLYLREVLKRMTPVLQEPVAEGIDLGIFRIMYPTECIETILLLGYMMFFCSVFQRETQDHPRKIEAFLFNAEKLLGAKEGELNGFLQMFDRMR